MAVMLALALVAMHVVAREAAATARDRDSHVAALQSTTSRYRAGKRQDLPLVQRTAGVEHAAAMLPAFVSLRCPGDFTVVATPPALAPRPASTPPRVHARAPPDLPS